MIGSILRCVKPKSVISSRSRSSLRFDLLRLRTRLRHHWRRWPTDSDQLHLGCGRRHVPGWLNTDVQGSDFDIDLACGWLPWHDNVFSVVVCQQVIEHLDLFSELLPLLGELRRVSQPGAVIWLACPDMAKICEAYTIDLGAKLVEKRLGRWPDFTLEGAPTQHIINTFFHQSGEHKNLFDFPLLEWALHSAGFESCVQRNERELLERFPEFELRGDDDCSIYVSASVPAAVTAAGPPQCAKLVA